MKNAKKILSILLSCLMLTSLLSVGVFAAEGTKDNPIDANGKWFGYGLDCFLLNPNLKAGDTNGIWYKLVADQNNILQLENIYKDVDYQVYATVNGQEYYAYENGHYNSPIITLPLSIGDEVLIHVIAQDTTKSGQVYLNGKFISGSSDFNERVKLKSGNMKVWVAANSTVHFQDDSLQAEYATRGLLLSGSNTAETTVISNSKNYTDTDADGLVELVLGGSAGSAGAPPVKPSFAIQNDADEDAWYMLNLADTAHECVYDSDTDADCNTCGAIREIEGPTGCQHEYFYPCDATCMICGELTNPNAAHTMTFVEAVPATCTVSGNIAFYTCEHCGGCWDNEQGLGMPLNRMMIIIPAGHTYDHDFDADCNTCGEIRHTVNALAIMGDSVSPDVNGLAIRVDAIVAGMQLDGKTAIYDNATIDGYKLISLGALVSNNGTIPTMEMVGSRVLNIPAVYLMEAADNTVSYAIRITDIPEEQKDTTLIYQTYFIYEDALGQQYTVYGEVATLTYNQVA